MLKKQEASGEKLTSTNLTNYAPNTVLLLIII